MAEGEILKAQPQPGGLASCGEDGEGAEENEDPGRPLAQGQPEGAGQAEHQKARQKIGVAEAGAGAAAKGSASDAIQAAELKSARLGQGPEAEGAQGGGQGDEQLALPPFFAQPIVGRESEQKGQDPGVKRGFA